MFHPDFSSGRAVVRPNDEPGPRPSTPEEIAAHNARILAQIEEENLSRWGYLREMVKGRDPAAPKQRASAGRKRR